VGNGADAGEEEGGGGGVREMDALNTIPLRISSITRDRVLRAQRIIKSITNDVHRAIAVEENLSRCSFRRDIAPAYNNTYQAWSLNVIRDSLLIELVMILMRIMDKDERSATLTTVAAIVSDRDVAEALKENARNWVRGRPVHFLEPIDEFIVEHDKRWREERAEREAQTIDKIRLRGLRRIKRLSSNPLIATLKKYRHKHIAHSGMAVSTFGAKFGDPTQLLKIVAPIVEDLCLAVTGHHQNFKDSRNAWMNRSNHFWALTVTALKAQKAERKKKVRSRAACR
jgi:hypothetical protein